MAEISVVIPTRDRIERLTSAGLRAALEQEDVDHEIVVVDDGSVDGTAERLAAIRDPRLRVVRRDRSGGISSARNAGIAAASGSWVAFLDDDDLWSPQKLRTQLDTALAANADLVYSGAVAVDQHGKVLASLYLPPPDELVAKLDRVCVIPAGCSNVIVRTELVRSVGGFDERFSNLADWDLWIRLAGLARVAVCETALVAYVLHEANMHVVLDPTEELDYLVRKHAVAQRPRRIVPDRIGYARWVASQRSRAGRHRQAAQVYFRAALAYRSVGNLLRAGDALLAKRPSVAVSRLRRSDAPVPVASPDWLARYTA